MAQSVPSSFLAGLMSSNLEKGESTDAAVTLLKHVTLEELTINWKFYTIGKVVRWVSFLTIIGAVGILIVRYFIANSNPKDSVTRAVIALCYFVTDAKNAKDTAQKAAVNARMQKIADDNGILINFCGRKEPDALSEPASTDPAKAPHLSNEPSGDGPGASNLSGETVDENFEPAVIIPDVPKQITEDDRAKAQKIIDECSRGHEDDIKAYENAVTIPEKRRLYGPLAPVDKAFRSRMKNEPIGVIAAAVDLSDKLMFFQEILRSSKLSIRVFEVCILFPEFISKKLGFDVLKAGCVEYEYVFEKYDHEVIERFLCNLAEKFDEYKCIFKKIVHWCRPWHAYQAMQCISSEQMNSITAGYPCSDDKYLLRSVYFLADYLDVAYRNNGLCSFPSKIVLFTRMNELKCNCTFQDYYDSVKFTAKLLSMYNDPLFTVKCFSNLRNGDDCYSPHGRNGVLVKDLYEALQKENPNLVSQIEMHVMGESWQRTVSFASDKDAIVYLCGDTWHTESGNYLKFFFEQLWFNQIFSSLFINGKSPLSAQQQEVINSLIQVANFNPIRIAFALQDMPREDILFVLDALFKNAHDQGSVFNLLEIIWHLLILPGNDRLLDGFLTEAVINQLLAFMTHTVGEVNKTFYLGCFLNTKHRDKILAVVHERAKTVGECLSLMKDCKLPEGITIPEIKRYVKDQKDWADVYTALLAMNYKQLHGLLYNDKPEDVAKFFAEMFDNLHLPHNEITPWLRKLNAISSCVVFVFAQEYEHGAYWNERMEIRD
jgi:hypothetical protein